MRMDTAVKSSWVSRVSLWQTKTASLFGRDVVLTTVTLKSGAQYMMHLSYWAGRRLFLKIMHNTLNGESIGAYISKLMKRSHAFKVA